MFKKIYILAIIATLASCRAVSVATPPSVHNTNRESVRTELRIDTVMIDRLREIVRMGDTVYIHDTTTIREKVRVEVHDTLYVNNTDTIICYVEQPYVLTSGDLFLRRSGIALWIILSIAVVVIITKFALWRR